jgi:hypothetical protein
VSAEPELRAAVRDAIANGVNPARLPGLEPTVDRVLAVLEPLRAWHEATVPLVAALAIYGADATLEALVAKARALNEASP